MTLIDSGGLFTDTCYRNNSKSSLIMDTGETETDCLNNMHDGQHTDNKNMGTTVNPDSRVDGEPMKSPEKPIQLEVPALDALNQSTEISDLPELVSLDATIDSQQDDHDPHSYFDNGLLDRQLKYDEDIPLYYTSPGSNAEHVPSENDQSTNDTLPPLVEGTSDLSFTLPTEDFEVDTKIVSSNENIPENQEKDIVSQAQTVFTESLNPLPKPDISQPSSPEKLKTEQAPPFPILMQKEGPTSDLVVGFSGIKRKQISSSSDDDDYLSRRLGDLNMDAIEEILRRSVAHCSVSEDEDSCLDTSSDMPTREMLLRELLTEDSEQLPNIVAEPSVAVCSNEAPQSPQQSIDSKGLLSSFEEYCKGVWKQEEGAVEPSTPICFHKPAFGEKSNSPPLSDAEYYEHVHKQVPIRFKGPLFPENSAWVKGWDPDSYTTSSSIKYKDDEKVTSQSPEKVAKAFACSCDSPLNQDLLMQINNLPSFKNYSKDFMGGTSDLDVEPSIPVCSHKTGFTEQSIQRSNTSLSVHETCKEVLDKTPNVVAQKSNIICSSDAGLVQNSPSESNSSLSLTRPECSKEVVVKTPDIAVDPSVPVCSNQSALPEQSSLDSNVSLSSLCEKSTNEPKEFVSESPFNNLCENYRVPEVNDQAASSNSSNIDDNADPHETSMAETLRLQDVIFPGKPPNMDKIPSLPVRRRPSVLADTDFENGGLETVDLLKNKMVVKTVLQKGDQSLPQPRVGQLAQIKYRLRPEDSTIDYESGLITVVIGEYDVVPGLDLCVRSMYPGEKARLFVNFEYGYRQTRWSIGDLTILADTHLNYTVYLCSVEPFPEIVPENRDRILNICEQKRCVGNKYYNERDLEPAIQCYSSCIKYLEALDTSEPMLIYSRNNLAVCELKLGRYEECIILLDIVIAADPENWKALIRMSNCLQALCDFDGAIMFMERAASLDDKTLYQRGGELGNITSMLQCLRDKRRMYSNQLNAFYGRMFNGKNRTSGTSVTESSSPISESWTWRRLALVSASVLVAGLTIALFLRKQLY